MILWSDEGPRDSESPRLYGLSSPPDNGSETTTRAPPRKHHGVLCRYSPHRARFLIYGSVYDVVNCIMFTDYCRVFSKYQIHKELCKSRLIVAPLTAKGGLKFTRI